MTILQGNGDGTFQAAAGIRFQREKRFPANCRGRLQPGRKAGPGRDQHSVPPHDRIPGKRKRHLSDAGELFHNSFLPTCKRQYLGLLRRRVADFNGDGLPDVAMSCYSNGVSVLQGNGDGTFQTALGFAAIKNYSSEIEGYSPNIPMLWLWAILTGTVSRTWR